MSDWKCGNEKALSHTQRKKMSRQSFLKTFGRGLVVTTGTTALAEKFSENSAAAKTKAYNFESDQSVRKAMLLDTTECVGCNACTRICRETWDLDRNITRTEMVEYSEGLFKKSACQHCGSPSCVDACPTGAMYQNDYGHTVIDHASCVRCNYCVANCPFDAIQFDKKSGVIEKCDFCAPDVEHGEIPACAEGCPMGAIQFGNREELMQLGEDHVRELWESGLEDANLYGAEHMGGLAVLTILQDDPEKYDLPKNPETPLSVQLWDKIPFLPIVLLGGGLVLGFNFIHTRKNQHIFNRKSEPKAKDRGEK